MSNPSTNETLAEYGRRTAAALERVPANIAALIRQAQTWQVLVITLDDIATAQERETVMRASAYFQGVTHGTWASAHPGTRIWSLEEWSAVTDYGHEMEAQALARLGEGRG